MALPLLVCFVAEVLHLMKALYCFRRPPLLLLLLYSVLYYTDEWSRLHKSFKILWTAAALPLLVCFVAEVLHLMKALYCFRRPPLLLLYSVLYYTD
jgi:hypothetical protein